MIMDFKCATIRRTRCNVRKLATAAFLMFLHVTSHIDILVITSTHEYYIKTVNRTRAVIMQVFEGQVDIK